jgi:GTP cyclohydrolase II
MSLHPNTRHLVKLTTHPSNFGVDPEPLEWGARDPRKRGPVVATVSKPGMRNAIGAHSGTYSVYRAVALAVQPTLPDFRPDFTNTLPPNKIGPFEAWYGSEKIVSLDPWGHVPQDVFSDRLADGTLDIRPTIAVTKSHLDLPEIQLALKNGTLKADGVVIETAGGVVTTKAAIEPVWNLPEVAKRFGCEESQLRRALYEQTGGMFPELVTRDDLKLFLPPINGVTMYIIGSVESIPDVTKPLVVRLHDESADSDIFAADASTCRPYLIHGIVECVRAAQAGGAGLVVYSRQEGNALGEVAKFLVHNARKKLGDSVNTFFEQQRRVAGADDARLYEFIADPLLWIGVKKIDKFVSTSSMKVKAMEAAGIEIVEVTGLPERFVPQHASIEAAAREELKQTAYKTSPDLSPNKATHKGPPPSKLSLSPQAPSPKRARLNRVPSKEGAVDRRRIVLTTHPAQYSATPQAVCWGAADPKTRGPIVATLQQPESRNAIGTHNGPYAVYRAVTVAKRTAEEKVELAFTEPAVQIGPYPSWADEMAIVAMDPWGHLIGTATGPGGAERKAGLPMQPTVAVSEATLKMPEVVEAIRVGRLKPDGDLLKADGVLRVTKCAIEPVWYLPGIAKRFNLEEAVLRRKLFEQTGGMFPELITRTDLSVFLPPIGGTTAIIIGDAKDIPDLSKKLTVRVHDECNGSDVFGSDICTCRPYLTHGIEECIRTAQEGGTGLIVYNRKEGRALGEVTKFMVYNARKRQEGGDTAMNYFKRTEMIAGVQDMRFQELMPDPLLWLGVRRIDRFISMSDMKYDAITGSGIEIVERCDIPDELIPADAKVEIDAKVYAGYYAGNKEVKTFEQLAYTVGRGSDYTADKDEGGKIL